MAVDDIYTKALLHLDTAITDESGKTWTAAGGASITTSAPKFGAGCLDLGAVNSGKYIYTPDSTDFEFGNGDFTIEFWYKAVNSSAARLAGQCASDASALSWEIEVASSNSINFTYTTDGSTPNTSNSTATSTDGNWHHLAMVRYGTSFKGYIDGVAGSNVAIGTGTIYNSPNNVAIGIRGERTAATQPGGFYDEIRISKGIARYVANFTPPALPFFPVAHQIIIMA